MKWMKITSVVSAALLCASVVPHAFAASTPTEAEDQTCSYQTCMDIVEDAMEQYAIEVTDTEEYKAYIWEYTQENAFTAERLQQEFQQEFGNAAEEQAQYEARQQDVTVNCAEEVLEALNEINAENNANYLLGAGSFEDRQAYLDAISLDRNTFKAQLEAELLNGAQGEMAENLWITAPEESVIIPSPLSVRETINQTSAAVLSGPGGKSTIAQGTLTSIVFSATGNAGSYIYERIVEYKAISYGEATNGTYTYGPTGSNTTTMTLSGYMGFTQVNGQMAFSVANM